MKTTLSIIVILCLTSCISTKTLQTKLNKEKIEINTLHIGSKTDLNEKVNISLEIVDKLKIEDTKVTKNKKTVVPLLVLNTYYLDYQIKLGQKNLTDKLSNTFQKEFQKEIDKFGSFTIKEDSDYLLKINFQDFDYQTKFTEDFFGLGSFTTTTRTLIHEKALIALDVSLYDKKEGKMLFEKQYNENQFSKTIDDEYIIKNSALRRAILNKFGVSLSNSLEKIISQIVKDINEASKTLTSRSYVYK